MTDSCSAWTEVWRNFQKTCWGRKNICLLGAVSLHGRCPHDLHQNWKDCGPQREPDMHCYQDAGQIFSSGASLVCQVFTAVLLADEATQNTTCLQWDLESFTAHWNQVVHNSCHKSSGTRCDIWRRPSQKESWAEKEWSIVIFATSAEYKPSIIHPMSTCAWMVSRNKSTSQRHGQR